VSKYVFNVDLTKLQSVFFGAKDAAESWIFTKSASTIVPLAVAVFKAAPTLVKSVTSAPASIPASLVKFAAVNTPAFVASAAKIVPSLPVLDVTVTAAFVRVTPMLVLAAGPATGLYATPTVTFPSGVTVMIVSPSVVTSMVLLMSGQHPDKLEGCLACKSARCLQSRLFETASRMYLRSEVDSEQVQ